MLEWVLIMTLVYGGEAAQIATVEFHSEESCKVAGQYWMHQHEGETSRKSAVCVHL